MMEEMRVDGRRQQSLPTEVKISHFCKFSNIRPVDTFQGPSQRGPVQVRGSETEASLTSPL